MRMKPDKDLSPSGQALRYTIAGILSTIGFVPAQSHPSEMLTVSDLVIRTVNMMSDRGEAQEEEKPF